MTININNTSEVTLTKRGAEILNEYMEDIPKIIGVRIKSDYKEGDTYTDELWSLFHIFGKELYAGCDIPFKDNEIRVE